LGSDFFYFVHGEPLLVTENFGSQKDEEQDGVHDQDGVERPIGWIWLIVGHKNLTLALPYREGKTIG